MWWIALVGGLIAVAAGIAQVVRYFREGSGPERGLAGSGPAHRLVAAALFVTTGLFVSFFSLANLVALRAALP